MPDIRRWEPSEAAMWPASTMAATSEQRHSYKMTNKFIILCVPRQEDAESHSERVHIILVMSIVRCAVDLKHVHMVNTEHCTHLT